MPRPAWSRAQHPRRLPRISQKVTAFLPTVNLSINQSINPRTSPTRRQAEREVGWRCFYTQDAPERRESTWQKSSTHNGKGKSGNTAGRGTGKAARPAERPAQAAPADQPAHGETGGGSLSPRRNRHCKGRCLGSQRHSGTCGRRCPYPRYYRHYPCGGDYGLAVRHSLFQ